MIDADDLGHLLQAVDVFVEARKEVPDADRTAGLGDRPRMIGADLPARSGVGPIARDPSSGRVRQQQRLCRDLDRLLHHVLGRVRDIADKAEPVTGADHLGAEFGETVMGDGAGLEIADVVRRVVDELHVPDAALMRFLQPFELPLEEVEPLDIGDDRRLSRLVRRFEIGGGKGAAHAVVGDQLVHPGEAVEVVPVKLARLRRANGGERAFALRPSTGQSGTSARQATASDPARIAFARSSLGGAFEVIPVLPPWLWTSTEMELRSTASAAAVVSAVRAAAVEPRGPTAPASIAPTEASGVLHIQGWGARACP